MPRKKRSPIWFAEKSLLENLIKNSDSLGKVLKHFGLCNKGNNPKTLKQRLDEDGIDYSHMKMGLDSNKGRVISREVVLLESVMVENSTFARSSLKKRLIKENVIPYKCEICGQEPFWLGKPLSLVLDHKNGVPDDNRKENLRFLCPNCNSQTATFAGKKNKIIGKCKECQKVIHKNSTHCIDCAGKTARKVERPSIKELEKMLWEIPTTKIAKIYGVTDKAVEKWTKAYGLSKPERGYWAKSK